MCMVTIFYSHKEIKLNTYECPRCLSRVCDLPTDCATCGLTLISSAHLARSYHHLFPLQDFPELSIVEIKEQFCYGCDIKFETDLKTTPLRNNSSSRRGSTKEAIHNSGHYKCPECKHEFCLECDIFVHDTLHNCPGCK